MDAVRLAFGTLTIVPVGTPRRVDRRVAGWAMTLAPLVGAVLGLVPLVLWTLAADPLLLAALMVAAVAVLDRALHLDGLADTADGLGSRAPAERALTIMKQSDIGPFGVVALVLTLLVQVIAAATVDDGVALAATLVVSRGVLPLLCTRPFLPARPDGLGTTVAGSVSWWQAALALVGTVAAALAAHAPYSLLGLLLGLGFAAHCVRRLGGVTGDVYGAGVELTWAASLVAVALA